jgi:beta-glucanase (GH16 family)
MKILPFAILLASLTAHADDLCAPVLAEDAISMMDHLNQQKALEAANCGVLSTEPENKWQLVWTGGFDKDGPINTEKWKPETGGDGFGNDEDEFYTDRIDNTYVKDGVLSIKAKKEEFGGKHYTSGRWDSKQSFTYGRFEFTAKYPKGRGTWPAIWMLPDQQNYGGQYWPDNGELDVLEGVGHEPGINHASTHNYTYNFAPGHELHSLTIPVDNISEDFHTYAMEWLPDHISFYIDDKLYYTVEKEKGSDWKKWPYDKDFHIIMNLAVGGFWGRAQGIDDNAFPTTMDVKSIKVFRPATAAMCKPGMLQHRATPAPAPGPASAAHPLGY